MLQLAREKIGARPRNCGEGTMCEVEDAAQEGRLLEVFAGGTALWPPSNLLK